MSSSVKRGIMPEYPILQKNYTYLLKEISADDLKDLLHEKGIVEFEDLDKIDKGETTRAKNEILLGILRSRLNAFSIFLEVLEVKGYEHVSERLKRDQVEEKLLHPTPPKVWHVDVERNEVDTLTNWPRERWKCEDSLCRSLQDTSHSQNTRLLQEIDFAKKDLITSNANLSEQEADIISEIHSSAAAHKASIENEEKGLVSEVRKKSSVLMNANSDQITVLHNLSKRAKSSQTNEERKGLEMELEEIKSKMDRVSLMFAESKPSSVSYLGRVVFSESSGIIYKRENFAKNDQSQRLRLQTDNVDQSIAHEMLPSINQKPYNRAAILKFEISTKLSDESMETCGLTDVTVMPDGTVVITDGLYMCVKSFWYVANKLCHSRLPVAEPPWQVTRMSSTSVAVTIPSLKQIWLLSVKPEVSLTKVLKVDKEYRGLVRMDNGDLAVSAIHSYTPCIEIIDLEGKVKRRLYSAKSGPTIMDRLWYLGITHEGDILVSDISKLRLMCVSKDGDVKSTFKPEWEDCLEDPHGVCCDRFGNVYLARSTTNEIWCLTADGLGVVCIFSPNEGTPVSKPWGVSVNDDGWLYVAESDGMVKAFLVRRS